MSSIAAWVRREVASHPLVVFSKTYCPYCRTAKAALAGVGAKPIVYELDTREDGEEGVFNALIRESRHSWPRVWVQIQDVLKEMTGARSVPRVFIGGKCIGGGDDTAALARSKKLEPLLREAGALA